MKDLIERLEKLMAEAMSSPWTSCYKGNNIYQVNDDNDCIAEIYDTAIQKGGGYASLLAEGVSVLPLLIQEIKRLQEQKEALTIKISNMIEKYECKENRPDPIC